MSESDMQLPAIKRVSSGVPGLDTILRGGFFEGSIYIVRGAPGTGKTILTNQIIFHTIGQGQHAAYITLLGESNSRLFAYLSSLSFFQRSLIGEALLYHSASHVVENNNMQELHEMAKRIILDHRAKVLVIDGLSTMGAISASALVLKQFIRSLQAYCESQRCTAFILQNDQDQAYAIDTTVDGVLVLSNSQRVTGGLRELEIRKLRGSPYLEGKHQFRITSDGVQFYPRTEAVLRTGRVPTSEDGYLTSGIAKLDPMLGGGYPATSITMIFGTPGSGRTFIGQYFLTAGAAQNEPGMYMGFNESPSELMLKADRIGLPFSAAVNAGLIELMWQPPFENVVDALVEQLLATIEARGIRRLVIDGLEGFQLATEAPERMQTIFAALMNELRHRHVTTLFTLELQSLGSPSIDIPVQDVSMLADNIIFLRTLELRSQLERLLSIQKMRRSGFDTTVRRFEITSQGILLDDRFEHVQAVLTGQPHAQTGDDNPTEAGNNQ